MEWERAGCGVDVEHTYALFNPSSPLNGSSLTSHQFRRAPKSIAMNVGSNASSVRLSPRGLVYRVPTDIALITTPAAIPST